MTVYCDTSFLLSYLYEGDSNHSKTRKLVSRYNSQEFVLCEVHQLELPAAARAATHRAESRVPKNVAHLIINRFDREWRGRVFTRRQIDLSDTVSMARGLGDAHGWTQKHTAFDLWHLAAAWSLSCSVFLTFDERQKQVCKFLGMRTD